MEELLSVRKNRISQWRRLWRLANLAKDANPVIESLLNCDRAMLKDLVEEVEKWKSANDDTTLDNDDD